MSTSTRSSRIYALTLADDSGIGGGVVSQPYFKEHFGLLNSDGTVDKKKSDNVSSNVVSVLQAGAFFGALGSAPLSGERLVLLDVLGRGAELGRGGRKGRST